MISGRGEISGGKYRLPDAPGWGVSFDPDFIKHHAVA
jgi:L-alanine-DL-glutamate epimerase-like enolase superfamily enzyme